MARSHITTAAKVKLLINGRVYGKVLGFRWTSDTPKKPIYGIDSPDPYELAITTTRITGSVNVLKLSGDAGAQGVGVAAPLDEISREGYFSLELVEHNTDRLLFTANRCSLLSESWDVPSRGLVTGVLNFQAISWSNEIKTAPARR